MKTIPTPLATATTQYKQVKTPIRIHVSNETTSNKKTVRFVNISIGVLSNHLKKNAIKYEIVNNIINTLKI